MGNFGGFFKRTCRVHDFNTGEAMAGSIVIDMSSIAPSMSQKIALQCAQKSVEFLDVPVSGGEPGAINATLAIMVGGQQQVFDQCHDLSHLWQELRHAKERLRHKTHIIQACFKQPGLV